MLNTYLHTPVGAQFRSPIYTSGFVEVCVRFMKAHTVRSHWLRRAKDGAVQPLFGVYVLRRKNVSNWVGW